MIIGIALSVIAIAVVVCVTFALPAITQMRRSWQAAERLLTTLNEEMKPLTRDLEYLLDDAQDIASSLTHQAKKMEIAVDAIKDMTFNVVAFESLLRKRIEEPVTEIAGTLSSLARGLQFLLTHLKRKR